MLASAECSHQEPHNLDQRGLVDPIGIEPKQRVQRRRFGDDDHAGKCAQEPGYERRAASREVKDHARRLERRLGIESEECSEPGPDERSATRAGRPARNGLVEERFDEALRR